MSDDEYMSIVRDGLQKAQVYYARSFVSITDAINLFHMQTHKKEALPFLLLCERRLADDFFNQPLK